MIAALLSTSFAIVQAAPPPLLPDLKPKEVHLEQTGELTITVVNGGTADAPALVDSYVTIFVDGEKQVDIELPMLPYTDPDNTIELSTGVFLNGAYRRLLVFVDSAEVHAEENEYQNVTSMRIDVTWRNGADLSVDAAFTQAGLLTINVTNVGDQPSDPTASVLFDVDVAGTVSQFNASLNALQPGETAGVSTTITAPEFDDVTITMPFDSATDLDSTNNFVTRRHVNITSIDPGLSGTPYFDMLTNNQAIRDAIKFYPLCGHAGCSCPNDDCDGIAYDNWSGEWAFLKDGSPGVPGLTATILLLEQRRPLPFLDEGPEAAADDGSGFSPHYISEEDGAVVYLNNLALTLWFDVRKNSLHNISDPDWNLAFMASLLAPEDLEHQVPLSNLFVPHRTTLNGTPYFNYDVRSKLAAPTLLYDFMSVLNRIGPTMDDTAWAIIDWTRRYASHDAHFASAGGIPYGGSDPTGAGYHSFYPLVSWPRYRVHPIGGCGPSSAFVGRVLGPLGIPVAGRGIELHSPNATCGVGHASFSLPSITKPDAAPGDMGVSVLHGDDIKTHDNYGYTIVPSHEFFFSTDEAFCQIDLEDGSCPGECEPADGACSPNPVCQVDEPECICDITDPSCDPISIHPCAIHATYNKERHDALRGKEYLTGNWVYDYYLCACIDDPLCAHSEPTLWPECDGDPEYIVANKLRTVGPNGASRFGAPFAVAELDAVEELAFLSALAALPQEFGWDVSAVWNDIKRRSGNAGAAPKFTIDCNTNDVDDLLDIYWYETSVDCDANGIPDECQDTSTDCNTNGTWDACDIDSGTSADCNGNTVPDECDTTNGTSTDCNSDGIPDECEPDCNGNGNADECDITSGTSEDCDGTGVPDECETDCNGNGFGDACDLASGTSEDCNANAIPDECDIVDGTSTDDLPAGGDGIPDECQSDCNGNGIPDAADLVAGTSWDCNQNDVPDECDMVGAFYESSGPLSPFNDPAVPPTYTFANVPASGVDAVFTFDTFAFIGLTAYNVRVDLNGTLVGWLYTTPGYVSCADPPGQDQIIIPAATFNALTSGGNAQVTMTQNWAAGETCGGAWISVSLGYGSFDCNDNEIADDCELDWGLSSDCNLNLMLDECDIANGTSQDTNGDGIPDECVVCTVDADCDDGNECTDETCDSGICTNTNEPGGTTCDDGQFCTTGETCNAGVCGGGSATDCSGAGDQCNTGVCNETTDACEAQPANEGLACDDGLFCTTGETCTTGVCGGGSATDCSGSSDQCNTGVCNETTNACEAQPANEGLSCDDGDVCTESDVCSNGTCAGSPIGGCENCVADVDCEDGNECTADTCETGFCTSTNVSDGTTCDDGQFCTTGESCTTGVCGGGSAIDCSGSSDQCNTGVCNETTDACEAQPANEGLACDDGQFCTTGETCTTGVCGGGSATDCSGSSDQCNTGVCNETTNACEAQPANEGLACDDGQFCTTGETCTTGVCGGGSATDCSGSSDQCNAGVCNETTNACGAQPANEGLACDDAQFCTTGETCTTGICGGGSATDCSGSGDQCNTGMCNETTNACEAQPANEGLSCDDGDPCTESDVCSNGTCAGTPIGGCECVTDADCDDGNDCSADTCVSGDCTYTNELVGTTCDDGLYCTQTDECDGSGTCVGSGTPCRPNRQYCCEYLSTCGVLPCI